VSLLTLAMALVLLIVAREWAERLLRRARAWLLLNARTVAAVIIVLLAAALLRNGIRGLTWTGWNSIRSLEPWSDVSLELW